MSRRNADRAAPDRRLLLGLVAVLGLGAVALLVVEAVAEIVRREPTPLPPDLSDVPVLTREELLRSQGWTPPTELSDVAFEPVGPPRVDPNGQALRPPPPGPRPPAVVARPPPPPDAASGTLTIEVVALAHADGKEICEIVSELIEADPPSQADAATVPRVIFDARTGALILYANDEDRKRIRALIRELDKPVPATEGR